MALAIQVFDGDGIDHTPLKSKGIDGGWRMMSVMFTLRKEGDIVIPSEKFTDLSVDVLLLTKNGKRIYSDLIARDFNINIQGQNHQEAIQELRRYWTTKKQFNMYLKEITDCIPSGDGFIDIVKVIYCKGCKVRTFAELITDDGEEIVSIGLSCMSMMPVRDPINV